MHGFYQSLSEGILHQSKEIERKNLSRVNKKEIGELRIDNTPYSFPANIAIQYAVLFENKTTISKMAKITKLSHEVIRETIKKSQNFERKGNNVMWKTSDLPDLFFLGWKNTLVIENDFDNKFCNAIPKNKTEKIEYERYLKNLQENKNPRWYDYLDHIYHFNKTYYDFKKMHEKFNDELSLITGVNDFFDALRDKEKKIVLITNCSLASLEQRMKWVRMDEEDFDIICTSDRFRDSPLKTAPIQEILEKRKKLIQTKQFLLMIHFGKIWAQLKKLAYKQFGYLILRLIRKLLILNGEIRIYFFTMIK